MNYIQHFVQVRSFETLRIWLKQRNFKIFLSAVSFHVHTVASLSLSAQYHLTFSFECQTVSLDPDQALSFVRPDLGPNCLKRLSAKVKTQADINMLNPFHTMSLKQAVSQKVTKTNDWVIYRMKQRISRRSGKIHTEGNKLHLNLLVFEMEIDSIINESTFLKSFMLIIPS